MGLKEFTERTVRIDGGPFSLAERPYLNAIYDCHSRNIVLRASRQCEKSTFLVNTILYAAVKSPGISILFVSPRLEQARHFSNVRLRGAVMDSQILRRLLWRHERTLPTTDLQFHNGSRVFVRSAFHSADAIRGISANMLLIDEFQDLAAGELPVIEETLSHAANPRMILTGTPKLIDNHLEAAFANSTACEWRITCDACRRPALLDERVLGPDSLLCPGCRTVLDPRRGEWIPRNPTSTWGSGYWINHLFVPWFEVPDIILRQQTYDPARFRNEVLGLPTDVGDHIVSRQEMEACCEDRPFANVLADVAPAARSRLVAGIDWGFGGAATTILVIGYIEQGRVFRVIRINRWTSHTNPNDVLVEVARWCHQFHVQFIAADGGGVGRTNNRLLLDRLQGGSSIPTLYSIFYSDSDQQPVREGVLWRWTVNRSGSIGTLFARIKKRLLRFPRVAECGSFLDEFTSVVAVYDNEMRTIRFTKAETQRDDALHATNYAELIGLRMPEGALL